MKLVLTTCLLLATSALASYIDSTHQESVQPIDYNDDPRLRGNPAAGHIFFNYQQLRLDQPPQVDIRDEDVGRYMYRTRTTPATLPLQSNTVVPVQEINLDFMPFNKVQAEKRYPSVDMWQQQSTSRTPVVPTTTPKWEQFSQNFQVGNQPQHNPSAWASQIQAQTMQPQAPPTFAPRQDAVRQPVAQAWHETRPLSGNRGNHKFNWDDVLLPLPPPQRNVETPMVRAPATSAAPTTPPTSYAPRTYPGGAPPGPPTLTPWTGDQLR